MNDREFQAQSAPPRTRTMVINTPRPAEGTPATAGLCRIRVHGQGKATVRWRMRCRRYRVSSGREGAR